MNLPYPFRHHWILAAVSVTAAILFIDALWIPIKAEVAQFLLARSWQQTLAGESNAKPWPWADTRAIAILEIPHLGLSEIVLEGSSGRNLAFGPTLVNASPIDKTKDRILSGHRDTHFNFLKDLKKGDLLRLITPSGTRDYLVSWLEAIDSSQQNLVIDENLERLTLMTCYPFNTATTGGPMRWVVTAIPSES